MLKTCISLASLTILLWPAALRAESAQRTPDTMPTAGNGDPVVGGTIVPDGVWPDTAGVQAQGQVFCSGVLIAPDLVLTAGHCIFPDIDSVILDTTNLNSPGEVIGVIDVIEYPNSQFTYDIGLLRLAQPSTVPPRLIASGCVKDLFIADDAPVTIVGWGAIDNFGNEYVDDLMEADTVITDHDCSEVAGCNASVRPDGELGAGGMGIDSCFGDSGGPLYLLTERGEFLVGVTSRGYDDNTLPCSQGGIYTRIDSDTVLGWIAAETGITLPEPVCNYAPEIDPIAIEVEAGETVAIEVLFSDADAADSHVLSLGLEPIHGRFAINGDGLVEYTADADYEGADSFTVEVTDDGLPALTGTTEVDITVVPASGCGCRSSSGASGGLWLLLLALGLLWRRSRRPLRRGL